MPTKTSPERPGQIYVLSDPKSGDIRYLGITTLSYMRRFSMHKSSVTGGKHSEVYEWMAALREEDLEPIPSLVEDNVTDPQREVYWIALLHEMDCPLLNMDHGGTGKGKTLTAEHARKIGEGHVGIKRTLASRLKQVRTRRSNTVQKVRVPNLGWEEMPSSPQVDDAESEGVARIDSPITGSVLGQNMSRLRELAAKIAAHDEKHTLEVIEGQMEVHNGNTGSLRTEEKRG